MLTIDWPGTDAEGWTDQIPMEWFAKTGHVENLSHPIYYPEKRPLLARLSIDVSETEAVLNYCGRHEKYNRAHKIEPGLIKVLFNNPHRQSINEMLWKDAENDPEWVASWAVFGITDEVIGVDEGDRRLAMHMRSERKPWLAAEKKEQTKDLSGHLSCEACGPGLNDTYRPDIAFGIYEVHHRRPISEGPQRVTLADLAVLCPNCHRAIHQTKPMPSVEDFRSDMRKI